MNPRDLAVQSLVSLGGNYTRVLQIGRDLMRLLT
jgi:hypothetical protein